MSVPYTGDFSVGSTVYLVLNTFTSDDPSASSTITNLLNTDIHIHKNNNLTQRNNAGGITVSVNFDGTTGNHQVVIDTNNNAVPGFWVAGADYFVRMEGTTVDAATVNAWIGHFSIENRSNRRLFNRNITPVCLHGNVGRFEDLKHKSTSQTYDNTTDSLEAARDKLTDIETDTDVIDDGTSGLVKIAADVADILTDTDLIDDGTSGLAKIASDIDGLNDIAAADVWTATVNVTTVGATPTTAGGKLQGIWNRLFTKKTVTASKETSYETDDSTEMEAWALADDDTTASRTR